MAKFDSASVATVIATVAFTDAVGNAAVVDGVPVWESSNPAVAGMVVSPDGLTATFTRQAVGLTSVTVTADADLGEGIRQLVLTGDLEFIPGEAVAGNIVFAAA